MTDLHAMSTRELLRLYASILTILNERKVVRSRNAPAGDLAEVLVQRAYCGTLADPSVKSWDVKAEDGRLIQVKCRVVGAGKRSQTYSPFRSWAFDACVFVVFNALTYDVLSATEVPAAAIEAAALPSDWVRGSRVTVAAVPKLVGLDVTARVAAALEALDHEPAVDRASC
jgi:hypothetical protein